MQKWFVKSQWLHQDKTVYFEIIGDSDENTWIDLHNVWIEDYLDKAAAPIHTIIDISGLSGYSSPFNTHSMHSSLHIHHPNIQSVILIGIDHHPVSVPVASILNRALGDRFQHVESFDSAKATLIQLNKSSSETV